jgi:glucose/arabinose dehydrogenase
MKKLLLFLFVLFTSISFSQTIALQPFATGFSNPVEITHPVNDSRLFVLQRFGLIKILNSNGTTNATPFLDVSSLISTSPGNERGLLGLAFHPNYATNGIFFIDYTNTSGNTVIARYTVSANPDVANTSATILMTIPQPYSNHNGGCLRFGPDGYLYIAMGDGGSAGDPGNRAQNINENLGKILRIDVDTTAGSLNYGFPPTNPYVGIAGNDEIWAIGVRNPWKFSFNRLNGDLWIADVGQDQIEEVNKVSSPLPNNLNFGWRCYEGNSVYNNTSGCPPTSALTFPVAQYTHSSGGCSITGGYVYTGSMYPNFANKYFYSDYCDNKIRTIDASNNVVTTSAFTGNFVTFGEDVNGELYVAGISNGVIYKIIDSSLSNSTFEKNGFSLYPNPAKDSFSVKSSNTEIIKSVQVCDLSGKILLTKDVNTSNTEISISTESLTSGMYLVTIKTTNGNKFNSKLIVE